MNRRPNIGDCNCIKLLAGDRDDRDRYRGDKIGERGDKSDVNGKNVPFTNGLIGKINMI